VIEKIGLLDESFFAYWEDTDYSLRSLKGEFRNVVCSAARVYHKTRLTSAGEEAMRSRHFYYYYERNYLLLRRKELHGVLARARFYLTALAEGSLHARRCPPEFVDFSLMGLWHGIKGINGPMSDGIRMPNYLKGFLLFMSRYHPVFFADLMTLNLGNISRKALRRLRPTTD
jgi:GT2 family glycosyltransferase